VCHRLNFSSCSSAMIFWIVVCSDTFWKLPSLWSYFSLSSPPAPWGQASFSTHFFSYVLCCYYPLDCCSRLSLFHMRIYVNSFFSFSLVFSSLSFFFFFVFFSSFFTFFSSFLSAILLVTPPHCLPFLLHQFFAFAATCPESPSPRVSHDKSFFLPLFYKLWNLFFFALSTAPDFPPSWTATTIFSI